MRIARGGRRCLVCDELLPKRSKYRSVFEHSSDMDDVDRGLSERLAIILDSKLIPDQIHSAEICHLCEAKAIQIEEYFRLLLVFRESFKKTVRKYAQRTTCSKKGTHSERNTRTIKRHAQTRRQTTNTKPINKELARKPNRTAVRKKDTPSILRTAQAAQPQETAEVMVVKEVAVELGDGSSTSAAGAVGVNVGCVNNEQCSDTCDNSAVNIMDGEINIGVDSDHHVKYTPEDASHTGAIPGRSVDSMESIIDSVMVNDWGVIPQTQNCSTTTYPTTTATTKNVTTVVTMTKRFAGKRKYKCIVCSKVFANMRNLKRHQVNHSENRISTKHQCPVCKRNFMQSNSLLSHIKLHNAEGVETFPCAQCSHLFLQEADLRTHKEKCVRSKRHKCSQCNLRFRCTSERINHEMIHIGNKPFKCSTCEKSFSRKQILKEHSRLHSGEHPYKCSQCSATFRFRSGLSFHVNKVHNENRPHDCTLCDKSFAVIANLHSHLRIHTGEKQFLCPECGRGFAQSGTLQLHLATHTKNHPYKCPSCEKAFKRMDTLQRHTITHTGDRPYKCGQCAKVYSHQRSLNTHMLTHSGSKPYTCTTCGKGFKRKVTLQEHAHLHTGEKSHRCDRCGKEFALRRYLKKHIQVHGTRDPLKSVEDLGNEKLPEEVEVMNGTVIEEVIVTESTSVELPEMTVGTEQLVDISFDGESITASNTCTAEPSLLPLDLHQPYTTQHHFQSEPHLTEHMLSEFNKPLPSSFPASPVLQPKPQGLTISATEPPHDLIQVCTDSPEMPSTMTRANDTQVASYAYTISQPEHQASLPDMADPFNETLNLKMEKYADYATRELCMTTPPGSFTCNNTEAVYNSMSLVQAHDQLTSGLVTGVSLYPAHHPDQEYH